jgi:hypothetical protein
MAKNAGWSSSRASRPRRLVILAFKYIVAKSLVDFIDTQ